MIINKKLLHKYKIVILYNDLKKKDQIGASHPFSPDRNKAINKIREAGFDLEIFPASRLPANPFGRSQAVYRGLDPLRALRILLTRRSADLVYAHLESAVVLLLLRKIFFFKPQILIWEVPWSPGWRYRDFISRIVLSRADCAVVFGSNQIELIHRLYGAHRQTEFVPFWVDYDFYRPMAKVANECPYVLSMGQDIGRDFITLLKAVKGLSVPVIIKGGRQPIIIDSEEYPNVYIETRWLSYVEYRNLYVGASVVVICTLETPNACGVSSLLEAYGMGKPTIVSDNPALRDYLPPSDAGIVVPVNDPSALRSAIIELINNTGKAVSMGIKARELAVNQFNFENHANAAINLFRRIINGRER